MKKSVLVSFFACVLLIPFSDALAGYSNLFVFGDSLSDSGNNAIVLTPNVTPIPIPGNSLSRFSLMRPGITPTLKCGRKSSHPNSASAPTPR